MKPNLLPNLFFLLSLSLLAAGCSQVVSNPAKGELDDDGFYYTDVDWVFSEWTLPEYFHAEFFDSVKYLPPPEENIIPIPDDGWWLVELNETSSKIYGGFFIGSEDGVARYMLSMDKVDGEPPLLAPTADYYAEEEPMMEITALIEPIEYEDRLFYPIESSILDTSFVFSRIRLYNRDGTPYRDTVDNVLVVDSKQETYSLEFSANIILAGKYMGTSDGASLEELVEKIRDRLNKALNPGGVNVKELNILYAKDHPRAADAFPESEQFVVDRDASLDALDLLAKWPGHEGEISFVLGYYVQDDSDEDGAVAGFSASPGAIYNGDSDSFADIIVISSHIKNGRWNEDLSSTGVANTAIHELGHFFGLSHTTEFGGYAFDNLDDTPECPDLQNSEQRMNRCPDRHYLMFPKEPLDWEYSTFTPQQMDVIRQYLSMHQHK